ncbi:Gfo/Idh/MocA family protein [Clostridium gasigenes]|uniref:Gfo/Idh/MocA family protein n=1 Tax=Clostridium gasigenes TaxID=94869 RepID=UPI00143857AC|nr:Gfo/Idh/MocA family oxidoreductase [Clostridium gasigenes]MBU3105093.1 Gfo/Idh/MocA family oxidoreductase [Clostridium gasigenes]MBU3107535.1 Gfo/Idh/MocA family oxidoreductase [Clostridium gasigenes]NKF08575.1 Gfo/Idh/MocA family oxidoreductase [Clostridium gasigenes]QSW19582.1 Gfo/Idh/MocA family oxidoreductase [Clostridium gasigenes]
MKKIEVAIIGCGNIFAMHGQSIKEIANAEIVAVCDINEERAKEKAIQYNCNYYVDYKEMLEKEKIDVIHICLPHYLHAEVAIYASNLGKHVLTEKPMSISIEDGENMVKAAKDNNVTLGVIFQNRYNAGSVLIKETLKSGLLGIIKAGKLEVTWDRSDEYYTKSDWKGTWDKEGGGVIIDQAIHTMDLMRWFVDDEIEYINANISNRTHEVIEVEDSAEGVIKYKNGAITAFHAINYYTYDAPVKIEIHCENGLINMIGDKAHIKFNDGRELIADNDPNETFDYGNGVKGYWGTSHKKQINNFYNALEKGIQPHINGEEALKTQKMICSIYDSGKKGVVIKF